MVSPTIVVTSEEQPAIQVVVTEENVVVISDQLPALSAAQSAAAALVSQQAAAASEVAAAASEDAAALSATAADASEAAALASQVAAAASESSAALSAGTATTQAGIATTQAGIATSAASTATTQAGIATTQASAASASAAAALLSQNSATSSASAALASQNAASASAAAALVSQNSAAASAAAAAQSVIDLTTAISGGTLVASFTSIKASLDITLAATRKLYVDGVAGVGGDTYLVESSANVLDAYAGNVNALRLTSGGAIVTGTLSASGITSVTDTTEATSTTAASLKTAGGLGVAKAIRAGLDIYTSSTFYAAGGNNTLALHSTNVSTGYTAIQLTNTGGNAIFGQENSTGGNNLIVGATGYDTIVRGPSGIAFSANNGSNMQMRLSSAGLALAATGKLYLDAGGDTYLVESSANVLDTYVGGVNILKETQTSVTVSGDLVASGVSMSAIDKTMFSATIVDTFLYDTEKDSDGGAWRKRCAHTSWENETLSGNWLGSAANETAARAISGAATGSYYYDTTALGFYTLNAGSGKTATYRGNVRQFPAKVLITVEAARVVLWDLTQAGCPMWRVFYTANSYSNWWAGVTALTGAAMLNGVLSVVGGGGLRQFSFVADSTSAHFSVVLSAISSSNIASANSAMTGGSTSSLVIVSNTVNDVAMTALPNAPVDVATGLPVPTIAVATNGGVSVIKDDGTVTSKTITQLFSATLASSYKTNYIAFTKNKNLVFNYAYNSWGGYGEVAVADTSLTVLARYGGDYTNTTSQLLSIDQSTDISGLCALAAGKNEIILGLGTGDAVNPPGTGTGLGIIHDNPATVGSGLYAEITKNYNSGWQVGAIKGAWLADTVAETVTGAELVTNGTFTTDTTGWTAGNGATLASVGGMLEVTNAGATYGGAYQILSGLTIGKTYVVSADFTKGTAVDGSIRLGDGAYGSFNLGYQTLSASGSFLINFVATATTATLSTYNTNGSGATNKYDNISCRLADVDRSVKAKGLQVFGSLTKAAVASGAALMGYSGFSAANYLEQPYNSNLDFGTGDFCIMGWVNINSAATTVILNRALPGGTGGIQLSNLAGGALRLHGAASSVWSEMLTTTAGVIPVNTWTFIVTCRDGSTVYCYVNGVRISSAANTTNLSYMGAVFHVGGNLTLDNAANGPLALWRVSASSISAEQIKHIYETEKALFQASAQCCLAGTSNAVTALAYDEDTDLLHVGTSYGRSAFKGLVRASSEATPVGAITALAAGAGVIAQAGASGADVYVPAYPLREELSRKAEQAAKFGQALEIKTFTATSSQTAFAMSVGWTPKFVYRNGLLLREGSAEDYTLGFDGFLWTVTLASASVTNDHVTVMGVRSNG